MGSRRGIFVTLEGGEGSGKTTQSRRIVAHLESLGREEVFCRLAHPFWFQSFGAVMASGFLELLGTSWQTDNPA